LAAAVNKCDVNPLAAPIEANGIAFHIDPGLRKYPADLPGGLAGLGREAGSAAPHPHFPAVMEPVLLDAADIEPGLASASLITMWAGGQQFSRNHSRAHSTSQAVEVTGGRKLEVAAVISGF
jgi:hypothetical protein